LNSHNYVQLTDLNTENDADRTTDGQRMDNGWTADEQPADTLVRREEGKDKHPPTPQGGNRGRAVDALDPNFDRFWRAYPCQKAKKDAALAWDELHPDAALVEVILQAIARQRESDQWRRGKIPNPGNWLRGDRWNDASDENTMPVESPEQRAQRQQRERQARMPEGASVPLASVLESLGHRNGNGDHRAAK
jgi:hypothetical protein